MRGNVKTCITYFLHKQMFFFAHSLLYSYLLKKLRWIIGEENYILILKVFFKRVENALFHQVFSSLIGIQQQSTTKFFVLYL